MTFDEAVTHAQVATSLGCHTDDQHCMRVLGNEAQRLRSLFGNFQLECCDDWTCAEEHARKGAVALHEARAKVERLRAENAELGKKLECKRVRIEAMQANWSAERERTEADRQSADKLRANIAETQLVGAMEELDWFRRREALVEAIKAATNLHAEALATLALQEWEEINPKPGAGT